MLCVLNLIGQMEKLKLRTELFNKAWERTTNLSVLMPFVFVDVPAWHVVVYHVIA